MFVSTSSAGEWEHMRGPFRADQLHLTLVDLFDWNVLSWRDFRYYRVKISKFDGRPELTDRAGLVDVLEADVLWNVGG